MAEPQYLMFVDADDWIEPKTFEEFVKFMDANPKVDVCMCNGFVDEMSGAQRVMLPNSNDVEILDAKSALKILFTPYRMEVWAKMYRHSVIKNFKFDETLYMGEPYLFNWQLFNVARKIGIIPHRVYHYVLNNTGLSARNNYEDSTYRYDFLKANLKIYNERGENEISKFVATQNLLNTSINRLLRIFLQDHFEVDAADVEPYLKNLAEHKEEIAATVPLTAIQKILLDALARPFEKARASCRKIYDEFLSDMKNFCETYDEIFIYGTGHFGVEVGGWLDKMNISHYKFLTSALSEGGINHIAVNGDAKKILALSQLDSPPTTTGIILAMNAKNSQEVIPNLELRGYVNIFHANRLGIHL